MLQGQLQILQLGGNKEKVADSGAIYPLIQLATSPNANVQRQATRALFALAGSEKIKGNLEVQRTHASIKFIIQ